MALSSIFKLFAQTNNSRRGSLSLRERIDSIDLASCQMSYSQFFKALIACGLGRVGSDLRSNFCILRLYLASLPPYHKLSPDTSSKIEPLRKSFAAVFTATSDPPIYQNPPLVRQLLATVEENPLPGEFSLLMYLLDQESEVLDNSSETMQHRHHHLSQVQATELATKTFLEHWTDVATMSAATINSTISYTSFLTAFLSTLFVAGGGGGESFLSVLEKSMHVVMRAIQPFAKSMFTPNLMLMDDPGTVTPSEYLDKLTKELNLILTKIFHAYKRIFKSSALSKDGMYVFLADSSVYKNLAINQIEEIFEESFDLEERQPKPRPRLQRPA